MTEPPDVLDASAALRGRMFRRRSQSGQGKALSGLGRSVRQSMVAIGGVLVITFLMIRMIPGDPVTALTGSRSTEEIRSRLREQLNLDDPLWQQFLEYLSGLLRGDLGQSIIRPQLSVVEIMGQTLPITLALVAMAVVLATFLGVGFGLLGAAKTGGPVDASIRVLVAVLLAVPPFLTGLLLIAVVALQWRLFPPGGWEDGLVGHIRSLILPSLALALYLTPMIVRATRQAAIAALAEGWADAACARGVSQSRLVMRHVLPNSLVPVIALVGYSVGLMISAAVVVEAVFGIPGIGSELADAVSQRDYPVVQGIALTTAVVVVLSNLAADVATRIIDPRARR